MNTDIKQAMHVEAAKSFGTSEATRTKGVGTKIRSIVKIKTLPTIMTRPE